MMTGFSGMTEAELKTLGAKAVLRKPVSIEELFVLIEKLLAASTLRG